MALHLFLMPVSGLGTFVSPRAPKYAALVDGPGGWAMADGGNFCTVLADVSPANLASILLNPDAVEISTGSLDVAPNAITGNKVATALPGLTVPPGATARQMARLALENNQPALMGIDVELIIPAGSVIL